MIKILLNNLLRKLEVCGDHKPSSLPFCRFSKAISIRWKSLFLNIESVTPTTLFSSSLPPPPAESHVCKLHFQQKASFYYLKRCTAGLSWCTASSLALQAPQKKIREKKTLWKSLSKTTTKQSTKEVLATNHFFAKSAIVFFSHQLQLFVWMKGVFFASTIATKTSRMTKLLVIHFTFSLI